MFLLAASLSLPVVEVAERPDREASVYPGKVTPIARVDVVPQVSGEILEVLFENGADVKEGDVLYRLDSVKYEAAVKNAESKLAECKANVKYAELSYERHKNLLAERSASGHTRAAYAAAQAELIAAQDNLKHCKIVAPITGKIGSTAKTKGNYVTSGSLTLVTIVQLSPIRVKFSVSNRVLLDAMGSNSKIGSDDFTLKLTLANGTAYPGANGRIEYSDNLSDELTDTLTVYSIFDNEDCRLLPGGIVTVEIAAKNGVMRPAIPPTAILQDTQGPYVWVLDSNNVAQRRTVARGRLDGDWLFVEKGLSVGERIVADGAHRVTRGMKITPVK